MGLVKRTTTPTVAATPAPREFAELLAELTDPSPKLRRAAARDLTAYPSAAKPLCARLPDEPELSVRESILSTLMRLASADVVEGLIPYLASEDVWLRNAVIEALPKMPDACRPALTRDLSHPDADVRIFAVTTLAHLGDEGSLSQLVLVLADEPEVNVCAAAIEAVAERGTGAAIPALDAVAARFEGEPFIAFATELAISRIRSRLT
jgi:HEAT repeat protein